MKEIIKGKTYVVGANIDTDVIIPARYLNTMNPDELAKHAMEDLDNKDYPVPFLNEDGKCDYKIIVAGSNFGCGSSREHAPIALAAAGIEAVIAPTFARIYFRNSLNGGIILPLECSSNLSEIIQTGDELEISLAEKKVRYAGNVWQIKDFGPMKGIIEAGGLTAYNKKRLGYD